MANDVFNRLMQSASAAASIKQGGNIAQVANTQNIDYSRQADGAKAVISNPVSPLPAAATAPAISTKPQSTDKSDVLGDTLKNLGLLNSDYAAKETEYKAAQDAYTKAMQNAPADADFDTYLQPYRDRANAAEAALRSSRQNYENAGGIGHSYSGEDRVSDILKGGLGNSGAGAVNAAGSIYEGNVRGATSDWERELQNLRDQRTEAIQTYRDMLQRYGGDENNRNVQAALRQVQRISEDMGMYNKALRGEDDLLNTANRLYDTADNLSAASARDVARAKEGLGMVGQFAVDAGVAGVQMLGDAAIGAATGTGMLPVMGLRSYGSAAQEARQAGAGYEGQALYGIGSAAVEMLTEKIADGLAGLAGKGAADDVAEEVIRRLASSDTGRTVLRQLYGMSGEAFEEAISSLSNPALRALYDKGAAAKESYGTAEGRKALLADTAYDSLVGAALGGAGSFGSIATGQNRAKNTDLRLADAGFGGVDSQVNDAWNVLNGRTTAEQQAARRADAANALAEQATKNARGNRTITAEDIIRSAATDRALGSYDNVQKESAPMVEEQIARSIIGRVIENGRINNTTADQIARDSTLLDAFAYMTGADFSGMNTAQIRAEIQRVSRESNYRSAAFQAQQARAAQNDAARVEAARAAEVQAEQDAAAAQTEADAERADAEARERIESTAPRMTPEQSYVRGLLMSYNSDTRSVSLREILQNPAYRTAFEQLTGITLDSRNNRAYEQVMRAARSIGSGDTASVSNANTANALDVLSQLNIDNAESEPYNNSNETNGVNENVTGGSPAENRGGVSGIYGGRDSGSQGQRGSGRASVDSGLVLLSDDSVSALQQSGVYAAVQETTTNNAAFSSALDEARNADAANGWAVTPKSVEELAEARTRTFMTEDGNAGFAVAPDGDIEGVFANKSKGAPKGVSRSLIAQAIAAGGVKLDCYGPALARLYSKHGFVPVARVVFNPEYANPGWNPSKGTPDIYFLVYNGGSADSAVRNYGTYPVITQEQLDALPVMDYDSAYAYRDSLIMQSQNQAGTTPADAQSLANETTPSTAQNAESATSQPLNQDATSAEQKAPQPAPATATEPVAPGTNNGGESGPGLPPTDTTTAESTNGRGRERERGVSKDVRSNPNTDEPLRDSFEQNREMYHQLTNAEVTERANAIIDKGFDAARSEVEQAIGRAKAGMKLPPEIAVAGYQIANEMSRRGDLESARNLCADIAAELTAGGQLGQIGRLILNSDPAVRGMTVQKIVDKLNDGLSERQKAKNRNRGVGDESGQISVDDALVDSYVNAEDDAAASAALEQIEQDIADQIPATFRDKFTALRYLNMLGNLKTQGRNIIGNTLMLVATNAKYTAQSVAELAASAASGGKYQRNTSLFTNADLRRQAAADFDANVDEIKGESRYTDVAKQSIRSIADKQTIFGSGESSKWASDLLSSILKRDVDVKKNVIEDARLLTNWAMDQGDVIFMRAVYTRAFAGWMQAHGVTDVANATADQLSSARAFAAKEAQEATFHDSNAVSDWVSRIGRGQNTPAAVRAVSEGVMPFRKTPANVAVRAVEYSPVGIAETVYKGVQAAKGNATAADVINSAAKNVTGTALAIAGFFLAAAGKARGSGNDEDKELNDFQKMQGAMDYSVKIGDTHISLSQFAPSAIPFFMGVKLQELLANNEDLSLDDIGDMLGVISEPMLEMSMLQGVNDLLGNIASLNGNTDAIPSLVANAALSYLSQGLTNTLLGQAEQASEANRQTTYSDTKSKDANAIDQLLGSKGQYQIGKMSAKMPGWDYNQQDYVDAWGRTQSNGESGKRIINAFINPTYLSGDRSTKVDTELERLHNENADVEGFPNVFPQKRSRSATIGDGIVMTPDEYLQYSKAAGQKKLELVSDFMDSAEYKTLTDTQRAEVIQNLYSFADDLALQGIKRDNGITKQSDYQELLAGTEKPGNKGIPKLEEKNAGEYISFNSAYSSAQRDSDYSVIDDLLKQYSKLNSNTQAVLTAKNPKDLKNLLAFGKAGSGSESYYKIKEAIGDAQWDLDATSAQGSHVRMAGLADADVSTAEKDKLVDSGAFKLSGTAKSTYGILRDFGMQPKDISQWFENADWYASGTGKEPKADGTLNAYEVATAISKIPNLSDPQRDEMYLQFKKAIQRPNDAYDTWKEKSYTQALRQSTSYGRVTGKGTEMPSTAEAPAAAGQTQNVIDYLLNLVRAN